MLVCLQWFLARLTAVTSLVRMCPCLSPTCVLLSVIFSLWLINLVYIQEFDTKHSVIIMSWHFYWTRNFKWNSCVILFTCHTQKKAIRAINNLAFNEHTKAYFKCNKILKISDQYKLQVSSYIFQLLHCNIDEEIESSLLINNRIHSHNARTNNQMSILRVNRSKTTHSVLYNGMITWNSLPDIFKVNVYISMFKSKVRNFYIEKY